LTRTSAREKEKKIYWLAQTSVVEKEMYSRMLIGHAPLLTKSFMWGN